MRIIDYIIYSGLCGIWVFLNTCTIMRLETPAKQNPLVLASPDAKCDSKKRKEFRNWYILYGTIPLNKISTSAIPGNTSKQALRFRFTQQADWKDMLMSVALGITTSVTTNRLVVDQCVGSSLVFVDQNQKENWRKKQELEYLETRKKKNQIENLAILKETLQRPQADRWLLIVQAQGKSRVGLLEKISDRSITLKFQQTTFDIKLEKIHSVQNIKAPALK